MPHKSAPVAALLPVGAGMSTTKTIDGTKRRRKPKPRRPIDYRPIRAARTLPTWTQSVKAIAPAGLTGEALRVAYTAAGYGGLSADVLLGRVREMGAAVKPEQLSDFTRGVHALAELAKHPDGPRVAAIERFLLGFIAFNCGGSASNRNDFIGAMEHVESVAFWAEVTDFKPWARASAPIALVNLSAHFCARRWFSASELWGALDLGRYGIALRTLRSWRQRAYKTAVNGRSMDYRSPVECGQAVGAWLANEGGSGLIETVAANLRRQFAEALV